MCTYVLVSSVPQCQFSFYVTELGYSMVAKFLIEVSTILSDYEQSHTLRHELSTVIGRAERYTCMCIIAGKFGGKWIRLIQH